MKFKLRLIAPVHLTASCDIQVEAEDEDQAAEMAEDAYKKLQKDFKEACSAWRRSPKGSYPECPWYWSVEQDDIEENLNEKQIEVSTVEPMND